MELVLKLNCKPSISVRVVLPSDDKLTVKSKQKKQFINKKNCVLTVFYQDKQFTITAFKNYCFDGASIPLGIGKGDTRLFVGALFHDIICENKSLVDYDRELSTEIFKQLLIMCEVPKWEANTMAFFVNQYQKCMKGWKHGKS